MRITHTMPRPPMHRLINHLMMKDPKSLEEALHHQNTDPDFDRSLRLWDTPIFRPFEELDDVQKERLSQMLHDHFIQPLPGSRKMDDAKKEELISAMAQHGVFAVGQAVRRKIDPGDAGFNQEVRRWQKYLRDQAFPFTPHY